MHLDKMRHKSVQQSHPQLFHDSYRAKNQMDTFRVALAVIVVILCPLAIFNVTFNRVQNLRVQKTRERPVLTSESSKTIPTLPDFPKPLHGDQVKWHTWATKPFLGTYRNSQSAVLHFPYAELDPFYTSLLQEETKVLEDGEYPPPIAMKKNHDFKFIDPTMCFVLTRKGFKPAPIGFQTGLDGSANQDRLVIMSFPDRKEDFWIGLFDGHGDFGHVTSHSASLEFPAKMSELASVASSFDLSEDETKKRIREMYLYVDTTLPQDFNPGGSTAISIWKHDKKLFVSNLGDSQAFVASYDKTGEDVKIIYMTKPHKPDLPEERKRIEAAGGTVEDPLLPGFSARVIVPINAFDSMALAMSRALGDFEAKKIGVSGEPTTEVIDLESLDKDRQYFVVAATDGIFDEVKPPEVAECVAKSLTIPRPGSLPECLEELIRKSSNKWFTSPGSEFQKYRDDISIAVHRLII